MKLKRLSAAALVALMLSVSASPAFAVAREIIELQTQVQDLVNRVANIQQSMDQNMGALRALMTQDSDAVNKLAQATQAMQKILEQQNTGSSAKLDQVSGQIQSVNDTIDELRVRLEKTNQELANIEAQQQKQQQPAAVQPPAPNTAPGDAPSAAPAPGAASAPAPAAPQTAAVAGPPAPPAAAGPPAPPADLLYNNALRDYNAARYELAFSQFQDYLRYYPNTDLAGNSQFYIADIEFRAGNFEAAVSDYDKVLERFPGGNKAAAAQLKKGYALLELGRKEAGVRELNSLIQRYPHSIEATQARERLRKLGAAKSRPAAKKHR